MLQKDQCHVNHDKSDTLAFQKDKAKRAALIAENFTALIRYTEKNGFPDESRFPADSCRETALQMTLIHMAQTNPAVFFSGSNIKLFKKEITAGNLNVEMLKRAIVVMVLTTEICTRHKKQILFAIKSWGLQHDVYKSMPFSDLVEEMRLLDC